MYTWMPPEEGVRQGRLQPRGAAGGAAALHEARGHDVVREDHELLDEVVLFVFVFFSERRTQARTHVSECYGQRAVPTAGKSSSHMQPNSLHNLPPRLLRSPEPQQIANATLYYNVL